MGNNKQLILLVFFIGLGNGFLLASWNTTTTQNPEQYTKLEQRIDKVSENFNRLEITLETLIDEIQQLQLSVANDVIPDNFSQHVQTYTPSSNSTEENIEYSVDDASSNKHNIVSVNYPPISKQEVEKINLVINKLRTRGITAYPNLSSLLTSPDIANIGPVAHNQLLAEISRMQRNGELNIHFFSQK